MPKRVGGGKGGVGDAVRGGAAQTLYLLPWLPRSTRVRLDLLVNTVTLHFIDR